MNRQPVAGAPHGLDQAIVPGRFERRAQTADMYVNRAVFDKYMVTPNLIEQLCSGIHPLGMGHEEMQQAEFRWPQLNWSVVAGDPVRRRVEAQA